jgi:hypothetical protein
MKKTTLIATAVLSLGLLAGCTNDSTPAKKPDTGVATPSMNNLRTVANDFREVLEEEREKDGVYPDGKPEDIQTRVTQPNGGPFFQFAKLTAYEVGNGGGSVKFTIKTLTLPEGKNSYTYDSAKAAKEK